MSTSAESFCVFLQTLVSPQVTSENSTSRNQTITSWPTHVDNEHGVTEGLVSPRTSPCYWHAALDHTGSVAFTPGWFGQRVPNHWLFSCSDTRDTHTSSSVCSVKKRVLLAALGHCTTGCAQIDLECCKMHKNLKEFLEETKFPGVNAAQCVGRGDRILQQKRYRIHQ